MENLSNSNSLSGATTSSELIEVPNEQSVVQKCEKSLIESYAANLETLRKEFIKLDKDEESVKILLSHIVDRSNFIYCTIVKTFLIIVDQAINNSVSEKALCNFKITKRLKSLMAWELWNTLYRDSKNKLKIDGVKVSGAEYIAHMKGKKQKCNWFGKKNCVAKACAIQNGVNQILSNVPLYETLIQKIKDKSEDVDDCLIKSLDVLKLSLVVTSKQDKGSDDDDDDDDDIEDYESNSFEPRGFDIKILSEYSEKALNQDNMTDIQKYILKISSSENMGAGTSGHLGGVDGSMYNKGILLSISYTYEDKIGIGIDFGAGCGTTALTFAAISKWQMHSVECNSYRYHKALRTQNKLLLACGDSKLSDAVKSATYGNAHFYFNGNDIKAQETINVIDGLLPPYIDKSCVGLVYFFSLGWDGKDITNVCSLVKEFSSLKYFLTDVVPEKLKKFDLTNNLQSIVKLHGQSLAGNATSRTFYIYTYKIAKLPDIANGPDVCRPKTSEVIQKEVVALDEWSELSRLKRKVEKRKSVPYVPVLEKSPKKARCIRRRATTKYDITIEEDNSSIVQDKSTYSISKWERVEDLLDVIDEIQYPEECETIKSKLQYILDSESSNFQLKSESPEPKQPTDKLYTNVKAQINSLPMPQKIMLLRELQDDMNCGYASFSKLDTAPVDTAANITDFAAESDMINVSKSSRKRKGNGSKLDTDPTATSNETTLTAEVVHTTETDATDPTATAESDMINVSKSRRKRKGNGSKLDTDPTATSNKTTHTTDVVHTTDVNATDRTATSNDTTLTAEVVHTTETDATDRTATSNETTLTAEVVHTTETDATDPTATSNETTLTADVQTPFKSRDYIFSCGTSGYTLFVSKKALVDLTLDEKRLLETDIKTFLQTVPLISVLKKLYSKHREKQYFNNTAGDGYCALYFPLQVRDKVYDQKKRKYSTNCEFFRAFVKELISWSSDTTTEHIEKMHLCLLAREKKSLPWYFDTYEYRFINFPKEIKFSVFGKNESIIFSDYPNHLMLNYSNVVPCGSENDMKLTIEQILNLESGEVCHNCKKHVYIIDPKVWKDDFRNSIEAEVKSLEEALLQYIDSDNSDNNNDTQSSSSSIVGSINFNELPPVIKVKNVYFFQRESELKRLLSGSMITDNVIAYWIRERIIPKFQNPMALCFPDGMVATQRIQNNCEDDTILRLLQSCDKDSLERVQMIVWVFGRNGHFFFCVLDLSNGDCRIFDSIANSYLSDDKNAIIKEVTTLCNTTVKSLREVLSHIYYNQPILKVKSFFVDFYPQQSNSVDCGIYVCKGIEELYKKGYEIDFLKYDVEEYRQKMGNEFLKLFQTTEECKTICEKVDLNDSDVQITVPTYK